MQLKNQRQTKENDLKAPKEGPKVDKRIGY